MIRTLPIPTPFAVGRVNCYLVEDDPLTLVDSGPNSGTSLTTLEAALAEGTEHPNHMKRRLAREIVALYRGGDAAAGAEEAFDRVFKRGEAPEEIAEVRVEMAETVYLPGLLKELGLVASTGEGRRQIDQDAVRVDGEQVAAGTYDLPREALEGRVVQVGKRRYARPLPLV